jgi:hypothetical protein
MCFGGIHKKLGHLLLYLRGYLFCRCDVCAVSAWGQDVVAPVVKAPVGEAEAAGGEQRRGGRRL